MATVRACLDGSHTWTEAEHTLVFCINSSSLSFHPTVSLAAPITSHPSCPRMQHTYPPPRRVPPLDSDSHGRFRSYS